MIIEIKKDNKITLYEYNNNVIRSKRTGQSYKVDLDTFIAYQESQGATVTTWTEEQTKLHQEERYRDYASHDYELIGRVGINRKKTVYRPK